MGTDSPASKPLPEMCTWPDCGAGCGSIATSAAGTRAGTGAGGGGGESFPDGVVISRVGARAIATVRGDGAPQPTAMNARIAMATIHESCMIMSADRQQAGAIWYASRELPVIDCMPPDCRVGSAH